MNAQDYIDFIEAKVAYSYYPYAFPIAEHIPNACAVIKPYGGFPKDVETKVERPSFQILVRGDEYDFQSTEAKAIELNDALGSLQEVVIGGRGVTKIQALNSSPIYIGMDELNRPLFSINFNLTVRP